MILVQPLRSQHDGSHQVHLLDLCGSNLGLEPVRSRRLKSERDQVRFALDTGSESLVAPVGVP